MFLIMAAVFHNCLQCKFVSFYIATFSSNLCSHLSGNRVESAEL